MAVAERLRRYVYFLVLLAFSPLLSQKSAAQTSACSEEPSQDGAYYCSPQGWIKLQHVMSRGEKLKDPYRLFAVPVLMPQEALIFPGAHAPVEIHDRRPMFLVREGSAGVEGSVRDLLIVRLDSHKNERDLQITSGNNPFTFKKRIGKDRSPEFVTVEKSRNAYTVTPTHELAEGEYMLTFGTGQFGGYDFGIER